MEHELLKLSKGFFEQNTSTIITLIFFGVVCSAIESIVIPSTVADVFSNINEQKIFKYNLIKLVLTWIIIKVAYYIFIYYRKQIEPEITQYITLELIKSVFKKYENENEIINVTVLINKIQLIKKNIQELFYICFTVFIPRFIVMLLSCFNFYVINNKLGIIVFICVILQIGLAFYGITECIEVTYNELENRDELYEYIEDLFHNIDTIQSTPDAFNYELKNLLKITDETKVQEKISLDCINKKQYEGYISNIITFSIIVYTIYSLYVDNHIDKSQVTKTVLTLTGLFENMYEITYYIPEITSKLGILKSNEEFLQNLITKISKSEENLQLSNCNIEFNNVTFYYDKHMILKDFSVIIPENKITCFYGETGCGKTTCIKLIFGIEKPDNGIIKIGENDTSKYSISSIRKYLSLITQNTSNLFNTTIYKNIIYGYEDTEILKDKVKNIFIKFDFYNSFKNLDEGKTMWAFLESGVGKLGENISGGQKEIIFLLRLELNETSKIVLLDEPTAALDDDTRNNVIKYIKYLKTAGKTIIVITHDKYFKTFCDNILIFSRETNPIIVNNEKF